MSKIHTVSNTRKIWDIPGGIHPQENKTQSVQTPISAAPIPKQLVFPLGQHIGAPAEPCVEVGQYVLRGEKIAEAKGFVSAPIHASSSGTITAIEQRPIPHSSGLSGLCIVLDTDGKDESIAATPCADYTALDKQDLLNKIRNAGIAGMGGAGFPSAVKLATDKPIETLIINATECEPYITADDILMRERSEAVVEGVKILQHLIQPHKETLIGIEDNKPEAIAALNKACEGTNIQLVVFPTKYPSGGEKQLIMILTGKEVPNGGLPADIGIVCQNIGTTYAIKQAVIDGKPLTSRITTFTGDTLKPQNLEVRLGTPIQYLLEHCNYEQSKGSTHNHQRLIMGGPMMGFALHSDAVPIVKTTNCILAPTPAELPEQYMTQACIRCGMCAEACPASLLPQQLYWFARSNNHEQLETHNLFDCIECGACSYSCPSHIPLVQYYRSAKANIREEQADRIKAEKAKVRFEQRQERLEKEAAEKEARRKARKEAAMKAKSSDAKKDVIAEAIARTQAKKQAAPAENIDPAQAAIERAKQARANPQAELSPKEKLSKEVSTLEKRIANAEKKMAVLEEQGSDKLDALKTSLDAQREKLAAAKAELAQLDNANTSEAAPVESLDPAQAAIEKAKKAREAQDNLSPEEKQAQELAKVEKRIAAQQKKYQAMLDSGDSDKAELIKTSLDKLLAKKAELAPSSSSASAEAETKAEPKTLDPAQAAIEKAKKAREAQANLSPEEKQAQELAKIEKRIAAQEERYQAMLDSDDDADKEKAELIKTSIDKMLAKKAQLSNNTSDNKDAQ